MASKPVKISEELLELARAESEVMFRSAGAQVEYWARLGRRVEMSGALGSARIREIMSGRGSVQDLTAEEDALYMEALSSYLESLDGSDTRIVDDLRSRGRSIASIDEDGKVVIEKP
jgi:hypothetical protein